MRVPYRDAPSAAGVVAIEDAVYRGVNINATVSFATAQTIAVAEAIERGMNRREAEGLDTSTMGHVCTIMVGRTDDWLKKVIEVEGLNIDPAVCDWAGVAVFKNAYRIYKERVTKEITKLLEYRNFDPKEIDWFHCGRRTKRTRN